MKLFRVWLGVYAGDPCSVVPELARRVIKELCALLGPELDPDEEAAPAISTLLIGAQIEFPRGFVRAAMHRSKSPMAIGGIKEILKANTLSTSHAYKIRGN